MNHATRDHRRSRSRDQTHRLLGTATLLLALPFLVSGCESSVEPDPLVLEMSGEPSVIGTWVDSGALLHCSVDVSVAATGEGTATWRSGEVEYEDPELGPLSSEQTAEELAEIWGAAGIAGGATMDASYPSIASGEHSGTIRVVLEDAEGGVQTVSHTYECVAP